MKLKWKLYRSLEGNTTTELTIENGKKTSEKLQNNYNHKPLYTTIAAFSCINLPKITNHRYAFKRADWDSLNSSIEPEPFIPYCYSNVNEIIRQWYEWLWEKIEKFVPRITEHRSRLQPWITPATSHLIKKLQTMKRKPKQGLERLLKIKKLEKDIQRFSEDDLAEYEKTVLEGRTLNAYARPQQFLRRSKKETLNHQMKVKNVIYSMTISSACLAQKNIKPVSSF